MTRNILLFSIAALFALPLSGSAQTFVSRPHFNRITTATPGAGGSSSGPTVITPTARAHDQPSATIRQFPWRNDIVTTVFWIGEKPTANNPTPNNKSSWDADWSKSFGGYDNPDPSKRRDLLPVGFTPRQNPFYCALPYNDKARVGHRPEAARVVPWFREAYQGPAVSTLKGRWIAIRKGNKVAYAQWEDAGPFRTDHWQYVFGTERPKPNLNKGAGLDVSPAVRDYLGLADTDVTDWKFVDFSEVPVGPWSRLGENNTFVINQKKNAVGVAQRNSGRTTPTR